MSDEIRRGDFTLLLSGVLIFVVFAVGIFLFVGLFTSTALISFVFTTLAFALAFATPKIASPGEGLEARFLGIPLVSLGVFYFFAQVFAGVVFMIFQQVVPFNIAFFIQLAILVVFVVALTVGRNAQLSVHEISERRRSQAQVLDLRVVDVQSVLDMAKTAGMSAEMTKALEHLAETIRYSDPFGSAHPAIAQIESRIEGKMIDLQMACSSGNEAEAIGLVRELENLCAERSRKLLIVK